MSLKQIKEPRDTGRILVACLAVIGIILLAVSQLTSFSGAIFGIAAVCLFACFTLFPQFGVYLSILALPLINWNFYTKGLIIPAVDLIAGLSMFAYMSRSLFNYLFSVTKEKIRLPAFKPFLFFLAVALLSGFVSKYPAESVWYTMRWILFFYLAYIVVPVNVVSTKNRLRNSLILLVISASYVAAMGIASLFYQDWQNSFVRIEPVLFFNSFPIGSNQNLIAEFLVIAAYLILALKYWTGTIIRNKWIHLIAIGFGLIAIATFSRAAWIVLFAETVLFFLYQSKEFKNRYIVPVLLSLVLLAPFAFYMAKIQSEYSIGVSSTENRLLLSQISVNAWKTSPILGQGSGVFYRLVEENIRFRAKYGEPLDSHGVWQKILAENGSLGVLAFVLFSVAIFKPVYKGLYSLRNSKELKLLLPLALGAFGGYLFQFFNTSYYKGKMWLPIGLALAATYILLDYQKKQHGKEAKN